MKRMLRPLLVLAVCACVASALCLAESPGQAIYKAHCQGCHGADGMANTGAGKLFQIKPVTDPMVRKMPEGAMFDVTKNGGGRMQSWKGTLSDSQIQQVVSYFRKLLN